MTQAVCGKPIKTGPNKGRRCVLSSGHAGRCRSVLSGQGARQAVPAVIAPGSIKLDGPVRHPSRSGLWPVPFDDAIPSSIAEFVERLRNAAAGLEGIASDPRISGAGVVEGAFAIEDRRACSDSFRSLYHVAVAMSDEGVCAPPPVMSAHNPLAPMIDSGELREWASDIEDGAGWARRAALRLSNQADYTDALLGVGAAEAV